MAEFVFEACEPVHGKRRRVSPASVGWQGSGADQVSRGWTRSRADLACAAVSTATQLKQTPLHDEHVRLGARMVDFGGWHMPVQYTGILEEHDAVRTAL